MPTTFKNNSWKCAVQAKNSETQKNLDVKVQLLPKLSLMTLVSLMMALGISSTANSQVIRYQPQVCKEDLSQALTPELTRARELFLTLTGVTIPFCDDRLKKMAIFIKTGQARKATKVAVDDPLFYDIKVRDMAMKWCHLDESVRNEINDCVAMVVGSIRDGIDIREMLSGNYHYQVDRVQVPRNSQGGDYPPYGVGILASIDRNSHFSEISRMGLSMHHVLRRQNYQLIGVQGSANNSFRAEVNTDPGGLLTSRGFLTAHAVAGTNRRLVEYSFKQFMCTPIQELADNTLSDMYVGPDVERRPAGDTNKFLVSCKSCHAPMDSMRPAFASVDTNQNGNIPLFSPGVVRPNKFVRDGEGYIPASTEYENLAITGSNATKLGWRGPTKGKGIGDFAKMLAASQAFSSCMVKNVFKVVCGSEPGPEHKALIETLTADLEAKPVRDLRPVFERLALRPECVGK